MTTICDREGIKGDQLESYVTELYDRNVVHAPELLAAPGPPNGNEWLPHFDLRRAIMQIQLDRGDADAVSPGSDPVPHDQPDFAHTVRRLEMASYVDAHLDPRGWANMEVS